MKSVEVPGEAPAGIRVGDGIAAAMIARANLRRAREKDVSPEGTASEPQGPKPIERTRSSNRAKQGDLPRPLDRLSDQ